MTDASKPYIQGDWDDAAWRMVASTPAPQRSAEQEHLFKLGPRRHPFGATAIEAPLPGTKHNVIWPSQQAYDEYVAGQPHINMLDSALANGDQPTKAD